MQNAAVLEPHRTQAESKPGPTLLDSSQKPVLHLRLESFIIMERKDHDLDGYLFDDSCLFLS
jgi:hypothetical protein